MQVLCLLRTTTSLAEPFPSPLDPLGRGFVRT